MSPLETIGIISMINMHIKCVLSKFMIKEYLCKICITINHSRDFSRISQTTVFEVVLHFKAL